MSKNEKPKIENDKNDKNEKIKKVKVIKKEIKKKYSNGTAFVNATFNN